MMHVSGGSVATVFNLGSSNPALAVILNPQSSILNPECSAEAA